MNAPTASQPKPMATAAAIPEYRPPLPEWTRYGLRLLCAFAALLLVSSVLVESASELRLPAVVLGINGFELELGLAEPLAESDVFVSAVFVSGAGDPHALDLPEPASGGAATASPRLTVSLREPSGSLRAGDTGELRLRRVPRSLMAQILAWLSSR